MQLVMMVFELFNYEIYRLGTHHMIVICYILRGMLEKSKLVSAVS